MKLPKLLVVGALSAVVSLPLIACAQQAPQAQPPQAGVRHHGMGMRMFKNLNLTPDQQSKIKSIMDQFRQAHPRGSAPDPQARQQMRQQIDQILTTQQRDQLKAQRQQMRERRERGENGTQEPAPQATP